MGYSWCRSPTQLRRGSTGRSVSWRVFLDSRNKGRTGKAYLLLPLAWVAAIPNPGASRACGAGTPEDSRPPHKGGGELRPTFYPSAWVRCDSPPACLPRLRRGDPRGQPTSPRGGEASCAIPHPALCARRPPHCVGRRTTPTQQPSSSRMRGKIDLCADDVGTRET